MDPIFLSIITYITLGLGAWAVIIATTFIKIMRDAKKLNGRIRSGDKVKLGVVLTVVAVSFILVFVYPGLITMIPSAVAFIEIASIPLLWFSSENCIKDITRMRTH